MNNKLTADKARERIAHLTAWRDQRGLTLREEEYLEAMEIALTVLQQGECTHEWRDTGRELYCKTCGIHPSDIKNNDKTYGGHDQCLPEGTLLYHLEGKP